MNVLTSITVLGFLIFFHEMGHFLAAILQGIYVDGFSIGFGPSIIQKKFKEGWKEYEWRWKFKNIKKFESSKPEWNSNKRGRVLLQAEQGIGDILIFFLNY